MYSHTQPGLAMLLTIQQVAERLQVSVSTVRRLRIKFTRLAPRTVRVHSSDLEDFLQGCKCPSTGSDLAGTPTSPLTADDEI